jgi:hypothetical protein
MREEPIMISIRDLGVAAALVACEFEITDTYLVKDGRMHFVFEETAALDDVVNGFYTDTLEIKARKYFDAIKTLKGRIYANK